MDKIKKQYELSYGDKVILIDRNTLTYTTMFYQEMGMDNLGVWEMSGHKFKGNLYGKFHWNTSQRYWYYEEEAEEAEEE
jgi:hypothetical protein